MNCKDSSNEYRGRMRSKLFAWHVQHLRRIHKHVGSPYLTHVLVDVLICLAVIYGGMRWPAVVPPRTWALLVPRVVMHRYLVMSDPIQPMQMHRIDRKRLDHDRELWTLKRYMQWLIVNHAYIFPTVLTVYLAVLLIDQTYVFDLQVTWRYLLIDQTLLLGIVIGSGVLTVRGEEQRAVYETVVHSRALAYLYVLLAGTLSLLGTWIIMQQVADLGRIWPVIAILAGVLIWMVGMLLREEEERGKE